MGFKEELKTKSLFSNLSFFIPCSTRLKPAYSMGGWTVTYGISRGLSAHNTMHIIHYSTVKHGSTAWAALNWIKISQNDSILSVLKLKTNKWKLSIKDMKGVEAQPWSVNFYFTYDSTWKNGVALLWLQDLPLSSPRWKNPSMRCAPLLKCWVKWSSQCASTPVISPASFCTCSGTLSE